MKKLITKPQGRIIVDTEAEIISQNFVYDTFANKKSIWKTKDGDFGNQNLKYCNKIIASDHLENLPVILTTDSELREMVRDKEIDDLINSIKIVAPNLTNIIKSNFISGTLYSEIKRVINSVKQGYTLEQMREAIEMARRIEFDDRYEVVEQNHVEYKYSNNEIIASIQPPIPDCEVEIQITDKEILITKII